MAKSRKPAIEVAGRPSVSGGRKPKSPLDDLGKWIVKQGGKQLKKGDIQHIKRYARGIGWSGNFEKRGLADAVEKRVVGTYVRGSKKGSKKVQSSGIKKVGPKTKMDKLAAHKLDMYYNKQDKYARAYGDSPSPHARFFEGMSSGRAKRSEFNKRANAAWNAEVEIGRKYGAKNYKATKRALTRKVPKKK